MKLLKGESMKRQRLQQQTKQLFKIIGMKYKVIDILVLTKVPITIFIACSKGGRV